MRVQPIATRAKRSGVYYCFRHGRQNCTRCPYSGDSLLGGPPEPKISKNGRVKYERLRCDNTPLREAIEDKMRRDPDLTYSEIAGRLGWLNDAGKVDSTRVRRALGLTSYVSHGKKVTVQNVKIEKAVLIAAAVHLYPRDIGL